MADFRYYCDKHNMVYSCVRGADGKFRLACRKCLEEAQNSEAHNESPEKKQQMSQKNVTAKD